MRLLVGFAGILTDLAERETFDAIVVGSAHRGALGRVLLGSVGHGLLHGAPCPVAVAPTGYAKAEQGPFRQVAVAYDGTQGAKNALNRARALAEVCEDRVDLLVAGSRGYGPLSRVLLGSVATQLIGMAPCAVLVVPRS